MIWDVEGGDERVFVTLWFAGSFLCAVERRRGVMLGMELLRPSDACCFVFEGGCCVMRGGWWSGGERHVIVADDVFCFRVQVGDGSDGSTTNRNAPVSVSGLGSGVAMIALGGVRFVAIASGRYVVLERSVCI